MQKLTRTNSQLWPAMYPAVSVSNSIRKIAIRKRWKGIKRNLEALEGKHDVRLNPACGSVTVNYDHDCLLMSGILGFLEDMDVIINSKGIYLVWVRTEMLITTARHRNLWRPSTI
jgi:hypothetical protein